MVYADQESDLYQNWNRFYDPSIGRYLEPDPRLTTNRWMSSSLQIDEVGPLRPDPASPLPGDPGQAPEPLPDYLRSELLLGSPKLNPYAYAYLNPLQDADSTGLYPGTVVTGCFSWVGPAASCATGTGLLLTCDVVNCQNVWQTKEGPTGSDCTQPKKKTYIEKCAPRQCPVRL